MGVCTIGTGKPPYICRRIKAAWKAFWGYKVVPYILPSPPPPRQTCAEAHAAVPLPGDYAWALLEQKKDREALVPVSIIRVCMREGKPTYDLRTSISADEEYFQGVNGLRVFSSREMAYQCLEDNGLQRAEDVIHEAMSRVFLKEMLGENVNAKPRS
jgi:hypothetical protein